MQMSAQLIHMNLFLVVSIEIKSSNAPEAKLSANTKKYLKLRCDENARNAVFYLGDISMTINETAYVSWKEWSSFLD